MNHTESIEAYFTDVEHLRELFKTLSAAPILSKRLLVIHGVGGAGKSSLLWMFRLQCKNAHIATAWASGDEARSVVDILANWMDDLNSDGIKLPTLAKTIERYRVIQMKVDEQARKAKEVQGKAVDTLGKAAAKTIVETAATAIGLGPLAGALGGMATDALVDWLRAFLPKRDIDLLLDPAKRLTDDFRTDIVRVAPKQRIVLMLDTFELLALEDWVRDLAQQLHSNVLFVIAGRAMPKWSRYWPGWMAQAEIRELTPMTASVMHELVRRYYATIGGDEPNPVQVEAIIRFARGLPVVATSAVQLWVQYGVEDFQAVKPQVVADLVDRLLEGVPSKLVSALEAAATVRWFNKDILRTLTDQVDVSATYDELRRFPFVRPRVEGLALHDAVRDMMDENSRLHDPERHHELHERAATYFEIRLATTTGQEAERLGLERLYHRVRADEELGTRLFQDIAEELVRHRLVSRLRALINDANTYPLEQENNQLWREYYNARLAHLEEHLDDAEKVYKSISENNRADPKLCAYALCDWGEILARRERLMRDGDAGREKAITIIQRSLNHETDAKLISNLWILGDVYRRSGDMEKAQSYYQQVINFFEKGDYYSFIYLNYKMSWALSLFGDSPKAFKIYSKILQDLTDLSKQDESYLALKIDVIEGMSIQLALMGKWRQIEQQLRESFQVLHRFQENEYWYQEKGLQINRELGFVLGLQGKLKESLMYFDEALNLVQTWQFDRQEYHKAVILGYYGLVSLKFNDFVNAEERLSQSLMAKEQAKDVIGMPELLTWIGELHELKARQVTEELQATRLELDSAEARYRQSLKLRWTNRRYFECSALTGLIRVKHTQGDRATIPALLSEADQLAKQYEYNDHLASLRLIQGHIAFDNYIPEWRGGFDVALQYYQQSLVFALRYNRFMLDRVLGGKAVDTPMPSIISQCLEHGAEGKRMLMALHDWWQVASNDIGTVQSEVTTSFPEGIALLEAERIAREYEPGNGSRQMTVVQQLEAAYSK
jgi:tetratricopeptide (TPR) repeat protein